MINFTYAWEVISKFEWKFLPKIFPNTYIHKFGMHEDYHLVKIKDTYYDIQITEAKTILPNNDKMTTDNIKNKIILNIIKNFKEETQYTINNGVIFFKAYNWAFKVKIVKKSKDFDLSKITCRINK